MQKVLTEVLNTRGLSIDDAASVSLVEKGLPVPGHGITILFDPAGLDELLAFLDQFKPGLQSHGENETVVGKKNDTYEIIKLESILFFEADDNDTYCQTQNSRYEVKKKLYELEKELRDKAFVRVNKSYLVNVLMISEIIPWFGGRLLLKFKDFKLEVEVSRSNVASFKSFIGM
jgi:DNA-binding LytR/AlgR family response regulator